MVFNVNEQKSLGHLQTDLVMKMFMHLLIPTNNYIYEFDSVVTNKLTIAPGPEYPAIMYYYT